MTTHRKRFTLYGDLCKNRKRMEFQYKVTQNVLTLNPVLCKTGFKESNLCTFCNREKETIYHIFYRCTKVNSFWNQVRHWFNNTTNGSFDFTRAIHVMFGNYSARMERSNSVSEILYLYI